MKRLVFSLGMVCLLLGSRGSFAQPDQVGQWSGVIGWQIVAVHMAVLPTGNVMYYSYGDDPRTWNPSSGVITPLPLAGFNIFCTGHSFLADGRVLVTGGHIQNGWGLPDASIYDPFANSWTQLADMNDGRWYPTNLTMPNGEVLVISGSKDTNYTNNTLPQVWTGSAWRNLTGAVMGLDLYPDFHVAPNGRAFLSGPGQATRYLDTAGTGSWTFVANRQFSNRDYGSAVMYDNGKVVNIGGGDPSTATAEVIDLNAPTPAWRNVGSMSIQRRQMNATLLPDGKVLVTGGVSGPGFNDTSTPVFTAEMWDPATEQFTTMASMAVGRWYHSTAALLPDGRVISAGGDNNPNAEIYSPPYLFKGARPSITSAPSSVGYGQVFFVGTPDGASITAVNWVRCSTVTHATNMDQRMNRLSFSTTSGGLNVTAPSSSFLCPPGPYMLYLLNGTGVPSTGSIIRISTAGGSPPAAPSGLSAVPVSSKQIDLAWTDNSTNEDGFKVERSTDGVNFSEIAVLAIGATRYASKGLAASTTYHHRVRAFNASGDSAYSNTATATTLATGGTGSGLKGEYYDNIDFTSLKVTRTDGAVDFDWGNGSPDPSMAVDTFSIRWTGQVEPLYTQTYTFYTVTDDGVRLWVNNQLIIDKWIDQAPTEWSGTIALTALQKYDIKMEYYENGGGAVARLLWSSASQLKEVIPQTQLYPPTGNTTVTFTSIAAEDGYVTESSETSNAGGTVSSSSTGTSGLRAGDTNQDRQTKAFVSFDTSSIPDGAVIVSATLKLKRGTVSGTNPFTTHGACYADIKGGSGFGGAAALASGDFQAAADVVQTATMSNAAQNGDLSTGTVNSAGLSFINKTGRTQFRVYFSLDDNDDNGTDYIGWYPGDNSTASNRPVLEVVYQ